MDIGYTDQCYRRLVLQNNIGVVIQIDLSCLQLNVLIIKLCFVIEVMVFFARLIVMVPNAFRLIWSNSTFFILRDGVCLLQ
ncbi:MAG: hypothetical protein CM15mP83_8590 [Flavobacteriaceae bacterium]|nr:MAG: hypothetical protein CM15mP83_8590 [Flavobacteriaceae bacterium]